MTDDPDNGQGTRSQNGPTEPEAASGPPEGFIYHLGDQILYEGEWHQWAGWGWFPTAPFGAKMRPPPPAPSSVWRDDAWEILEPIPSGTADSGVAGSLHDEFGLSKADGGKPTGPGKRWWIAVAATLLVTVGVTVALLMLLISDDEPLGATDITTPASTQVASTAVTTTQPEVKTSTAPATTTTTEPVPEAELVAQSDLFVLMSSADQYPIYISNDRFVIVIPEIANCTFISTAPNVAVRYGICDHVQALATIANTNPEPPLGTALYELDGGNGMIVDISDVGGPGQVSVARILGGEEGSVPDVGSEIGFSADQVPELPDADVLSFDSGSLGGTIWFRVSG